MPARHDDPLIARVREALGEDPRTHMLDVLVVRSSRGLHLRGPVQSEARRLAAEEVARELIPVDLVLINETWVAHYDPPSGVERVS